MVSHPRWEIFDHYLTVHSVLHGILRQWLAATLASKPFSEGSREKDTELKAVHLKTSVGHFAVIAVGWVSVSYLRLLCHAANPP